MFNRKNQIKNNRYLLKEYKNRDKFELSSIFAQGRAIPYLTPAQMILLSFCIVAAFPPVSPPLLGDGQKMGKNENNVSPNSFNSSARNATLSATGGHSSLFNQNQTAITTYRRSNAELVPFSSYKGLPARNVTRDIACTEQHNGLDPHEREMVCTIENKMYYLKKYIGTRPLNYADLYEVSQDRILLNIYNLKFLKEMIGITVPHVEIVYTGDDAYLAWQRMDKFTPAKLDLQESFYRQGTSYMQDELTNKISQKLGAKAYHQWLVARTFIGDITENYQNYGTDKNNNLVILDADISPPASLSDYLEQLNYLVSYNPQRILLSLENVMEMKKIYESMEAKRLPKVHDSVDMPQEFYHTLLRTYIKICDTTLASMIKPLRKYGIDPKQPHVSVNTKFYVALYDFREMCKNNPLCHSH